MKLHLNERRLRGFEPKNLEYHFDTTKMYLHVTICIVGVSTKGTFWSMYSIPAVSPLKPISVAD